MCGTHILKFGFSQAVNKAIDLYSLFECSLGFSVKTSCNVQQWLPTKLPESIPVFNQELTPDN